MKVLCFFYELFFNVTISLSLAFADFSHKITALKTFVLQPEKYPYFVFKSG